MRIAITRLKEKAAEDRARCAARGHECYAVYPLEAVPDPAEIEMFVRLANEGAFDCIFFTSALTVRLVAPRVERWPRVVAIGPQTGRELEKCGVRAEVLGSFYSRDFVRHVGSWIAGKHVGIPRADVPNPGLVASIESAGGRVTQAHCYSLRPTGIPLPLADADAVLFTSAMSYRVAVFEGRPGLLFLAIGEVTASAMREGGHAPHVVGDGSLEGTLSAFDRFLSRPRGGAG
ncbi:MAG: uroporphyrinogen-III synthase [Methanolinea sp.]|nr:uroporphyrinogen-III synthase [Methanolinea sp.]